ncbi:hypothetical protein [Gorillibacterium timonense]|uniref:hypothetical protein n=1 Tax=Gorillibacterium timonense TaxID=1689269 RepID=UPI00071DDB96|nr:hypothetical protein [Gorillibacterium timonense]
MLSVIVLSINGDMYLFKNNDFSIAQYDALQGLANSVLGWKYYLGEGDEKMICSHFVEEVRTSLQISLEPVEISFVLRIK